MIKIAKITANTIDKTMLFKLNTAIIVNPNTPASSKKDRNQINLIITTPFIIIVFGCYIFEVANTHL